MTPAERHQRLAAIITLQDELAAAFMRLDLQVRELMRAEFCDPPQVPTHHTVAAELNGLPRIRRSR